MNFFRKFLRNNLITVLIYLCFILTLYAPALNKPDDLNLAEVGKSYSSTEDLSGSDSITNANEIIHFLQVTDTHVNLFDDEPNDTLEDLLKNVIKPLSPSFVIHTGDITDGKQSASSIFETEQKEGEWEIYKNLLQKYGYWNESLWFDIRGNHDSCGVKDLSSPNNYFYQFSPQSAYLERTGKKRVNHYPLTISGQTIHLISFDYYYYPQAGLPYGLYGTLNDEIIDQLTTILENIENMESSKVILFGHTPTAGLRMLDDSKEKFKSIIKKYDVDLYLNGHMHQTNCEGFTLSDENPLLELELASLKQSQYFRMGVLNEGLFSFSDQSLTDDSPVIVIANPKDAKYLRKSEPLYNMKNQQIRVMVFSPEEEIDYVKCIINEETISQEMDHDSNNAYLYFATWDPSKYDGGLHDIEIQVKLKNNKEIWNKKQPFSLDGTRKWLGAGYSKSMLQSNMINLQLGWFVFLLVYFIILQTLFPKLFTFYLKKKKQVSYKKFKQEIIDFEQNKTFNLLKIIKDHVYYLIYKNSQTSTAQFIYLMVIGIAILAVPITVAPMIDDIWAGGWTTFTVFTHDDQTTSHFFPVSLILGIFFILLIYSPTLQLFTSVNQSTVTNNEKKRNYYCPNIFYVFCFIVAIITFNVMLIGGWGVVSSFLSFSLMWPSLISLIWGITIYVKAFKNKSNDGDSDQKDLDLDDLDTNTENSNNGTDKKNDSDDDLDQPSLGSSSSTSSKNNETSD
ncbi:helicase related [Anaeramoeba flamelloides]|uniref:Helicase related n=1 Tax=Anaeramoeba flamelloides TaxID=1746091 RepID=A0AAV7YEA1_9EUKA|nr:helicase related [Anaeramoeba flamelloides]